MITVERENKRGLLKLFKDLQTPLAEGRTIVIFPEGTRSKQEGLLPFKSGGKMIAEKQQLRVQPVIIKNSDLRLDTKRLKMTPGEVRIRFLPSVTTEDEQWFSRLEEQMGQAYREL